MRRSLVIVREVGTVEDFLMQLLKVLIMLHIGFNNIIHIGLIKSI
jgi:hypothetical protein